MFEFIYFTVSLNCEQFQRNRMCLSKRQTISLYHCGIMWEAICNICDEIRIAYIIKIDFTIIDKYNKQSRLMSVDEKKKDGNQKINVHSSLKNTLYWKKKIYLFKIIKYFMLSEILKQRHLKFKITNVLR